MPLLAPYYRIHRPSIFEDVFTGDLASGYDLDSRYIDPREKSSLLSAVRLILKDYEEILEYVEPSDSNLHTYSHRIYELLLRTCTEVEANLEGILIANGYKKTGNRNINMTDYRKVEAATKLSDYSVVMHLWHPDRTVRPYEEWKTAKESLPWYKAYNEVKHDRSKNFNKANLDNLSSAICGLLCVLCSQFGRSVVEADSLPSNLICYNEAGVLEIGHFSVIPPGFQDSERYGFDWEKIKESPSPFSKFCF